MHIFLQIGDPKLTLLASVSLTLLQIINLHKILSNGLKRVKSQYILDLEAL